MKYAVAQFLTENGKPIKQLGNCRYLEATNALVVFDQEQVTIYFENGKEKVIHTRNSWVAIMGEKKNILQIIGDGTLFIDLRNGEPIENIVKALEEDAK